MTALQRAALVLFAAVFGSYFGSFLVLVFWRVPRHESIVRPRSHCPGCGRVLNALEVTPVVAWLVLRGRCRTCGERISLRYPLIELVGATLAAVFAWWLS